MLSFFDSSAGKYVTQVAVEIGMTYGAVKLSYRIDKPFCQDRNT
jgi:hypothetical protein